MNRLPLAALVLLAACSPAPAVPPAGPPDPLPGTRLSIDQLKGQMFHVSAGKRLKPVWPNGAFYFWTVVQAVGSLLGVGMMIRAYQITDASRASVLEYVILPASAFWTWVIWGKGLEPLAVLGMVLIVAAGTLIALRAKAEEA